MAATNSHYAAHLRGDTIYVNRITESQDDLQPIHLQDSGDHHVLAFSSLLPTLLAVSSGSQVLVFDVLRGKLRQTIFGNGRTITALAWSPKQANLLVSGTIDGSLSFWQVESNASSPLQLRLRGACAAIACSTTDASVLASIHDGAAVISKAFPLRAITLDGEAAMAISWHPTRHNYLLAGYRSGKICTWSLSNMKHSENSSSGQESDGSDSDNGIFGELEDIKLQQQNTICAIDGPVMQVQWVGRHSFIALGGEGSRCSVWLLEEPGSQPVQLWSQALEEKVSSLSLSMRTGGPFVLAVSQYGVWRIIIPQGVREAIGMDTTLALDSDTSTNSPIMCAQAYGQDSNMRPVSIATMKTSRANFARTSKQLQHRRPSFERERQRSRLQKTPPGERQQRQPSPPPPVSMTSSLELPKENDEDGSPMPFLSPSIPARKDSPGDLPPLDDSIKLPPLPRASFDSSIQSSAAGQESDDSDDETFVEAMQGSASFLPGGINVPLPKACAALFTPTGELLTFFPPKPKIASRADAHNDKHHDPKATAKKVAKLFPAFGNLADETQRWTDDHSDSGFESPSTISEDASPYDIQPSFSFFASSFPSQQSWKARISPTKHSFNEQSPHKVVVSLHNTSKIGAVLPLSRSLASQYRVLCDEDESGADLCLHNASSAELSGLEDVASVWRLMALLLEDRIPLKAIASRHTGESILVIARRADEMARNDLQKEESSHQPLQLYGKLRWTNNPMGAAWIIREVFDWAEHCADTQMLALFSAVLADAQDQKPQDSFTLEQSLMTYLPSYQQEYFTSPTSPGRQRRLTNQSIPVLRTNSAATSNAVYESPVKPKRSSTTSSRNQSQPTTPYLESESSTPPFSLPSGGRQNTQLSISGSASPEHHRSSFSAAAKYYAQSISDKFASYGAYGTSPPVRKMGTSPGELSTSFPSGSWGKSVSFASTTNTTKASLLSTSLESAHEDEGYDSDKTVEDLSMPQTPKDAQCSTSTKNDRWFDNDFYGGSKPSLLPEDMVVKCRIWCGYYSEQLRCWDLLEQAAELDKVVGMTCLRIPPDQPLETDEAGMILTLPFGGSKACSICSIKMSGLQFFCPGCSHSAHVHCLEDFIRAISADDDGFACPAGCGCQCADLPFETVAAAEPVREEKPKKKASFTDPMRWRARVEGDNNW